MKTFFATLLLLGTFAAQAIVPTVRPVEEAAIDCVAWTIGYIDAYETYTQTQMGAADYNDTYNNLYDHCENRYN